MDDLTFISTLMQSSRSGVKEGHKKRQENTTTMHTDQFLINFVNTAPSYTTTI
jgi:hypothetical protein